MIHFYFLSLASFVYFSFMGAFALHYQPVDTITLGSLVGICCLLTAFNQMIGSTEKGNMSIDGRYVFVFKYLEWTVNTSLLTMMMCQSYGVPANLQLKLTSMTASYTLCGLGAVLTRRYWLKCFYMSLGAFIAVLVIARLFMISQNPVRPSRVATVNLYVMMLTFPLYCISSLSGDVFNMITHKQSFIIDMSLSIIVKTFAILYCLGDAEYTSAMNMIWECPANIFTVVRLVLTGHSVTHHQQQLHRNDPVCRNTNEQIHTYTPK